MNAPVAVLAGTARPNFLVLTPLCVCLGLAAAGGVPAEPGGYLLLALALVGALFAHASVNMFNEHEDFRTGLDLETERTPFSGGSGTLPERPYGAAATLAAARLALAATVAVGTILLYLRGPALVPVGLLGLLLVGFYSTHIVRWPAASLIAPGLGFGPLMVLGTAFVLDGEYSARASFAALVPLFLVNGLLLLNQFPDVEADTRVGRRNLPIVVGRRAAALVFGVLALGAFAAIGVGIAGSWLPPWAALALLPGLGAPVLVARVHRHANDMERLTPLLGWNLALTLATIALLALALLM